MSNQTGGGSVSDKDLMDAVPPTVGAREFRVGIFVILGVLGFFTVLFLMTDPATFRGRYMVSTIVDNASGIRKGDPVQMRGVNIGRVHRFAMIDQGVEITLEVEGEWGIPDGSRTELVSNGVLGGVTVSVVRGTGADVAPLTVLPGEAIGGIFDTAGDLTDNLDVVLSRVEQLLSQGNVTNIGESVSSLQSVLADLADLTDGQAEQVAALTASLNRSASNVEGLTGSDELQNTLASAEATMATLQETATSLRTTSSALEVVLARMEAGEGTLGQLSVNDSLYTNLNSTLESLRVLIEDIKENPGRYIKIEVF